MQSATGRLSLLVRGGSLAGLAGGELRFVLFVGQVVPPDPRKSHLVDRAATVAGPVLRIRIGAVAFRVVVSTDDVENRAGRHDWRDIVFVAEEPLQRPVRLEFPVLLLHPGLRQRCVAPDRRHAVRQRRMAMPLRWKTSGLLGSRRAHAATNRQSAANRALIGRLLAVKAHASALRTSRSRDNRPWGYPFNRTDISWGGGSPSCRHALSEVRGRIPGLVPH